MLRDRNTLKMVAEHWECSPKTVRRVIDSGALQCIRIGRVIRVSREAIAEYEKEYSWGGTKTAPAKSYAVRPASDAYQRGREIAGELLSLSAKK